MAESKRCTPSRGACAARHGKWALESASPHDVRLGPSHHAIIRRVAWWPTFRFQLINAFINVLKVGDVI